MKSISINFRLFKMKSSFREVFGTMFIVMSRMMRFYMKIIYTIYIAIVNLCLCIFVDYFIRDTIDILLINVETYHLTSTISLLNSYLKYSYLFKQFITWHVRQATFNTVYLNVLYVLFPFSLAIGMILLYYSFAIIGMEVFSKYDLRNCCM